MAIEFGKEGVRQRLRTVPGIGPTLGAVLAAEIDTSERFPRADKLCAYAGLVPSAHASGGKVRHGRLLSACNQWLRWAFVEASWVAVGCPSAMISGPNGSPYFGALYKRQRDRGKKASTAITIIARRMCRIVWQLLREKRNFTLHPPRVQDKNVPGCPSAMSSGPNGSALKLTASSATR